MPHYSPTTDERAKLRAVPWFLAAGMFNAIFAFWTFGGSVFVLFLNELGMPKGQIGTVLSLFPFCGLLALGFAPVAARIGRKRVFLAGYGLRKIVMCGVLGVPWVMFHWGQATALGYLVTLIGLFAILRALAETAYYPWMQEFIPDAVRGKVSGMSALIGLLASALALGLAGWVISTGTGLTRFLLLIGLGSALGLLGVLLMLAVPGGAPLRAPAEGTHLAQMLAAVRDRNFRAYLGGFGSLTMGSLVLTSFLPLFVKERLGVPVGAVVWLDTAVMVGGGASLLWGWAADRVGSRPVLMTAAAVTLLVPLGWLLLPRGLAHPLLWCTALYLAYGVGSAGITISSGRLLFNSVIPPTASTAYTALYYAWIGVTGGLAPLLAGGTLTAGAGWHRSIGALVIDAHALLFLLAFLLLGLGWWGLGRVRPDGHYTTRSVWRRLLARGGGRPNSVHLR
jgi:MFS family permease